MHQNLSNYTYYIWTVFMSFLLLKRLSENKVNHPKQTKNGRGKKDYKDWTTKYKIWLVVACEKKGREEVSLKKK